MGVRAAFVDVPDVAELAATDGHVVLFVDKVVVTRDSGATCRGTQFTHRLGRLHVVGDVLQERVPVTSVLPVHRYLLAEEASRVVTY